MLCKIPWEYIRHSVSPLMVVLTETLQTGKEICNQNYYLFQQGKSVTLSAKKVVQWRQTATSSLNGHSEVEVVFCLWHIWHSEAGVAMSAFVSPCCQAYALSIPLPLLKFYTWIHHAMTVIAQERSWLSTACAILSTDYETSAEVIFGLSFKWYINICTSFTHLERSIHVLLLQRLFSSIFQSHPSQVLHHPDNHWLQPMSE